jgi:DnaJ family protein C protein 28
LDWESWIDQQIREAYERGEFDNLPGKGRPLDLPPNPYAKDRELAYKILKDAGFAPEWIELDKAIRGRLERARSTLARRWLWRCERLSQLALQVDRWAEAEREHIHAGWARAITEFKEEIAGLNKDIAELNLKVPSTQFQRSKLNASAEIERLTGEPA